MLAPVRIGAEVASALVGGTPVVALESTIFSALGLPDPANAECLARCEAAVRAGGAVPALTAVLDGVAVVGVALDDPREVRRVLGSVTKISARDLPHAVGAGCEAGVTTVSASVALAASVGIEVFATGGIGGVHRGAELTFDISHDLTALARHRVITVSAGAKAFLDLPRTLEHLETAGVPVVGWHTDRFPAFYVRDSGLPVPATVTSGDQVARMFRAAPGLGYRGGMLIANPIPVDDELDPERIGSAIDAALAEAKARGISGPGVTPVVLGAIAEATAGASIPANLALAENNAVVATEIAAAVVRLDATEDSHPVQGDG